MRRQDVADATGRSEYNSGYGQMRAWGKGAPTNGVQGFAPGCFWQALGGAAGTVFYINTGTFTSSNWVNVDGVAGLAVSVDSYPGVDNTGTTDSTVGIRAALATGLNIYFTNGKTYIVSGTLYLNTAGQTVFLNGATIKRANQVSTTTTAAITGGTTTQIAVASTTGFFVGQSVSTRGGGGVGNLYVTSRGTGYTSAPSITSISGGGGSGATGTVTVDATVLVATGATVTGAGSGYVSQPTISLSGGGGSGMVIQAGLSTTDESSIGNREITAVDPVGLTITVKQAFLTSQSSGATLYTAGYTFYLNAQNCRVYGPGIIDGNRANWTYYAWQSVNEFRIQGGSTANFCTISGVEIKNFPGDGIIPFGDNNSIEDCYIHDGNGNGTHLSGGKGTMIHQCRYFNTNLDISTGHNDGSICWSTAVVDGTIRGCRIDTTPRGGIMSNATDGTNTGMTIADCTILNCLQAGISIRIATASAGWPRVAISNCRLLNCGNCTPNGAMHFSQDAGSPTAFITQLNITGCDIDCTTSVATGIIVKNANQVEVVGCTLNLPSTSTQLNTQGILFSTQVQHAVVAANQITGFITGIQTGNALQIDVNINGNTLNNFHSWGIRNVAGGGEAFQINANNVYCDNTVTASIVGIETGDKCDCVSNNVYVVSGSSSTAISVTGSNNNVQSNQIRGAASQPKTGIVATAATTGNVIIDNVVTTNAVTQFNLNSTVINVGTATTAAAGANAGTSPPAPVVTAGSTNSQGNITFGTGTTPAAGAMVNVSWGVNFITAPVSVILSWGNVAGAGLGQLYTTLIATTGFTINCTTAPAGSQANTTYSVNYQVQQSTPLSGNYQGG